MENPGPQDVSTRFSEVNHRRLTPKETEDIQTAVHEDSSFFDADTTTIFILGHYGDAEKPHLKAVQDKLDYGTNYPRLMDEVFDFTTEWTAKFKLLVSYADRIVGVYEHSKGGHCWEAGYIDQYEYRTRTQVFYRIYDDDEAQYDAYNGMFWTYLKSLETVGRAHRWTDREELLHTVKQVEDTAP